MTSVCRRRNEAWHEASISAAVIPLPARIQGASREGPATLLASTMRWRMPGRAWSQRPMMASVSASLTCSPKVMVPRPMGVTRRSLAPSKRVFIMGASVGGGLQDSRRTGALLLLQAQHAPLHLARGRHRQLVDELDLLGVFVGRQLALHVLLQRHDQCGLELAFSPRLHCASSYKIRT